MGTVLRPAPGLTWQQLPEEARETVIRLMARLLSGHESGDLPTTMYVAMTSPPH
jgi:hypothetical protein